MSFEEAVEILIDERVERLLFTAGEAQLVRQWRAEQALSPSVDPEWVSPYDADGQASRQMWGRRPDAEEMARRERLAREAIGSDPTLGGLLSVND